MAHFAKINENNEVLAVVYIDNEKIQNSEGIETESVGQQYLETHNNWPAHLWIQTSYNTYENTHKNKKTPFRGNYASTGFTWDSTNKIFWPEAPYSYWVKNISNAKWLPPIGEAPTLTDTQVNQNTAGTHNWGYVWNETSYQEDNTTGWDLVDLFTY
jgi:hypothetical protein